MTVVYKAKAMNFGGREGFVKVLDSGLEFVMAGAAHPGTNPEQLFAAAYAGSFGSAVMQVIQRQELSVETFRVTIEIALMQDDKEGQKLAADISLSVTGINRTKAIQLLRDAYEICPYSRATNGNINVKFTPIMVNESSSKDELPG